MIFILFFKKKKEKLFNFVSVISFVIFWILLYLYVNTSYIISDMYFDVIKWDYYEKQWFFYNIHIVLSLLFFPLLFIFSYLKLKTLTYINKERLKYILFWIIIFIWLWLLFQLILPIFDIYLFEKWAILFVLPFLFFSWYSISKYNFIDYKFRTAEIIVFLLSWIWTIIIFILFKNYYLLISKDFSVFWGINNNFSYVDLIFWIIIFSFLKYFLWKVISWNNEYNQFIWRLNKLKEKIPFINNIDNLNSFLVKEAYYQFKVNHIKINLNIDIDSEIYYYFNKNFNTDIFINDIVFIEENKNKFNKEKILKQINKKIHIIFPMFNNNWTLIWVFEIWNKPLKEQYYLEEINIIKDFVWFLIGHLKYIDIYSEINDLNINLDKKVDEKTIEYNNLISKQREFISMSSHEIKTPVLSASLQVENILDDIEIWNYNKKYLIDEIVILKDQIFKISDLVKNIFTVQKYDIKEVWLYLEKVKLDDIIIGEYDILTRIFPDINFDINISKKIWFIDIDKIQFTQVISNLLNNAIKFVNINNPKILIKANIKKDFLSITIDDNWIWFNDWNEKNIFDKYSTWKWMTCWIWMWLYLCKKIVELHWWKISANKSKKLWWANFEILLPNNNK